MVKTTPLNDDTHKSIKMTQIILYERYNIEMPIIDIIAQDYGQIVRAVLGKKEINHTPLIMDDKDIKC